MSEGVALIVGILLGGAVMAAIAMAIVEGGWRTDCDKIGHHVAGNSTVYQCAPRK